MGEPSDIKNMDKAEQISLFSRLLEVLIRHAVNKKNEENVVVEKQVLPKSGSKFQMMN